MFTHNFTSIAFFLPSFPKFFYHFLFCLENFLCYSFRVGMLVISSINFFLSENALISPSFLKIIFGGKWILCWTLLYFPCCAICPHLHRFLWKIFCHENCFPPTAKLSSLFHCFKDFKFCLFSEVRDASLVHFLEFILFGVYSASWICSSVFWSLTETFHTLFISDFFSTSPFSSLKLWGHKHGLFCYGPTNALRLCSFFNLFCHSDLVISIILFSSSLIWSCAPSILLLHPSMEFLICCSMS